MGEIYKAHIRETTGDIQTVKEHSENTAALCRNFAVSEFKEAFYAMGLLHDVGKFLPLFQRRINGENIAVEHSICGAIEAMHVYKGAMGVLMSYCIAGHHGGLPDGGTGVESQATLQSRLKRETGDYRAYKNELQMPVFDEIQCTEFLVKNCDLKKDKEKIIDQFAFWTRYAFSCLVDADSLDTAKFCNGGLNRTLRADFEKALFLVNKRLDNFKVTTELQKSRSLIQAQVYENIKQDSEIYLMNMPTGSGKTLCSVKAALERAIRTKKKRIIYVIPYNSIIDQTAAVFENLFGENVEILRHQSTFSYEDMEDKEEDYRITAKSAVENWDAPFIVTTAVQFFESVYANKRGKLRKMHNMSDSILVFDEAHLMPQQYLQPCLQSIAYITKYLQSEAMFLTATMPDFEKLLRQYALSNSNIYNLVSDTALFAKFQKCTYRYMGQVNEEQLLTQATQYPSTLIVVNKKETARKLYSSTSGNKYHLSTYMAACDRKHIIDEIKTALIELEEDFPDLDNVPDDRRIIVISTSLIEAGVDLDFHKVYRELSGLDSILQAGGRCNREGKRAVAEVGIFEYGGENTKKTSDERTNLTKGFLEKYADISCPESIREYYDRLYFMKEKEIQKYAMHQFCSDIHSIPFKEYAERFEIVDASTVPIVVERDDKSRELITAVQQTGIGNARKLQKYACSVSPREFEDLLKQHVIDDYGTGIWCLTNTDYYDEDLGILFEAKDYII